MDPPQVRSQHRLRGQAREAERLRDQALAAYSSAETSENKETVTKGFARVLNQS